MRLTNRIAAAVVVLLGAGVWLLATGFPSLDDGHPGPGLFPKLLAVGLTISGLGLIFIRVAKTSEDSSEKTGKLGWLRLGLGVLMVAIFPFMRSYIGFIASLTILGLAIAIVLRSRLIVAVPVVTVSAILIYYLFTGLLGVPL